MADDCVVHNSLLSPGVNSSSACSIPSAICPGEAKNSGYCAFGPFTSSSDSPSSSTKKMRGT